MSLSGTGTDKPNDSFSRYELRIVTDVCESPKKIHSVYHTNRFNQDLRLSFHKEEM